MSDLATASINLARAQRELATGTGSIKRRLIEAMWELSGVHDAMLAFPEPIKILRKIETATTAHKDPAPMNDPSRVGDYQYTISKMTDEEAVEVAGWICDLRDLVECMDGAPGED